MKGYVVTLLGLLESVEIANRCIESGKKYSIDIEIFPAVDKANAYIDLKKEGLLEAAGKKEKDFLPSTSRVESNRCAVIGNFVSQYRIWKKIVESNEPGIVLEHDAVFVAPLPELKGKGDIINIGKPSYGGFKTKTTPGVYPMFSKPGGYIPGAHGYYLTPKGAASLVMKAQEHGASPCDLFLNNKIFPDIKELWPQIVEAQDSFTTIQNEIGCKAKHNYRKSTKDYQILSD